MKVGVFAAWVAAISGMSEDQRREAMVALEKASVVGGAAAASRQRAASAAARGRARNDRRRARWAARRGVPIALAAKSSAGAAHGLSITARAAGAAFNTLTKTPMAHLCARRRNSSIARAR